MPSVVRVRVYLPVLSAFGRGRLLLSPRAFASVPRPSRKFSRFALPSPCIVGKLTSLVGVVLKHDWKARSAHQANPRHGCVPRRARFRFAQQDHCSSHRVQPSQLLDMRHDSGTIRKVDKWIGPGSAFANQCWKSVGCFELLQLGVLRFRGDEDGDVGVGVFP